MPNYTWYILLSIFSLVLFAYIYWKIRSPIVIILYFFITGIAHIFEYVVYILLNSYRYYVGLLDDQFLDSTLGAISSNALSVPIVGIALALFNLRYYVAVLFTLFFLMIEWFFVHIGIYEHHWWRYSYTALGIFLFFWIGMKWNQVLSAHPTIWLKWITLYFVNASHESTVKFLLFLFFGYYEYSLGMFDSPSREHVIVASGTTFLIDSFILSLLVVHKVHLVWKLAGIGLLVGVRVILAHLNILTMTEHWSYIHFALLFLYAYLVLAWFNQKIDEHHIRTRHHLN